MVAELKKKPNTMPQRKKITGPLWRQKTYAPRSSVATLILMMIEWLRANIMYPDVGYQVEKLFNPRQYLQYFMNYQTGFRINTPHIVFTFAEIIRRIQCLIVVLKKIDRSNEDFGVAENLRVSMGRFRAYILDCGSRDACEYDILNTLCKIHNVMYQTIKNITA
jgi:hypothetical protein